MLPPSQKLLLVTAGVSLLLLCLVASRRRSSEVIVSHTSLEEPDGVPPPAPRTVAGWAAYHGALAAEVAKAKAAGVSCICLRVPERRLLVRLLPAPRLKGATAPWAALLHCPPQGVDFVLYGDSITESFRGTAVGMPADSYAGNAAAWRRRMAGRRQVAARGCALALPCSNAALRSHRLGADARFTLNTWRAVMHPLHRPPPPPNRRRALILAISGDETLHLLWRLRHGEGPSGLSPAVVTLMISTNDLFRLTMLHPVSCTEPAAGASAASAGWAPAPPPRR